MKSLISKGISTIQNDGLKVFAIRIWNYNLVKIKRTLRGKNVKNIEKWQTLKDKYKGKRVFIIGNGPSLNQMPLYLLEGEYTMAFNRFNLMFERLNWLPQFYMVTDDLVVKDMHEQINKDILPLVDYAFFPDIHPSNVEFDKYIDHKENVYWLNTDRPEFRADLPNCGINKTVVNGAIQVAAFLGFTDIYLIGVDMTFADQKVKKINSRNWEADEHDPNHFDPRYFGKGLKYHNPTVHEMLEKFDQGREFFESRNVHIYNAGHGGKLEAFPRKNFESLFDLTDEQKEALLNSSKVLKEHGLTFEQMLNAPLVAQVSDSYPAYFKTSQDLGVTLIPKIILEFLPVGPYKNQYFFVKR
ncbi:6-hydroxymethylpterin diphosphokinase MptE-like protein [Mucilaginibacter celer]|uniref:DUF115 domain-containing protein n=1 Tax=Mucilaginibacter celer TaxID=2305508 RepID=A0A494VNU7_9SPHI|nr:6-hydroxymethylpterin diphosphokinase MptE-like protein [Mucilaginibacter celer]AYL97106.1 DUF115 domain-containing protein [Mucilaginibacter celer]